VILVSGGELQPEVFLAVLHEVVLPVRHVEGGLGGLALQP
jgi:hypothetical protein